MHLVVLSAFVAATLAASATLLRLSINHTVKNTKGGKTHRRFRGGGGSENWPRMRQKMSEKAP